MKLSTGEECFMVAFEGPDRLGKSTQALLVPQFLREADIEIASCKIPYDDGFSYGRIYEMLFSGEAAVEPVVFQTLQGINRMFFQSQVLPGLAEKSHILIVDRWNLSTEIYGICNGVEVSTTDIILRGIIKPDLTVIFQGTPLPTEDEKDVYEKNQDLQSRVQALYQEAVLRHETEPRVAINANLPVGEVTKNIVNAILSHYLLWIKANNLAIES